MAKITVALNKFGRAQMFGPGTVCRCSDCIHLPDQCQWGGGPYAGTMLLYLQEIALNKLVMVTISIAYPILCEARIYCRVLTQSM